MYGHYATGMGLRKQGTDAARYFEPTCVYMYKDVLAIDNNKSQIKTANFGLLSSTLPRNCHVIATADVQLNLFFYGHQGDRNISVHCIL